MRYIFAMGLLIWSAGTVLIRLIGQHLLRPGHNFQTVLLYAISVIAMALLVRGIVYWLDVDRSAWIRVAGWLALPTLLLDPFSCIFFSRVFPNMDPASAGIFGGWMLISCCGAMLGGLWTGTAMPIEKSNAAGVSSKEGRSR